MAKRRDSNGRFMKSDDSSPKKSSSTKQEMQKEIDYLKNLNQTYKTKVCDLQDSVDLLESKFFKSLAFNTLLIAIVIIELVIIFK